MRLAPSVMVCAVCVCLCSQTGCLTVESLLRKDSPTLDTELLQAQGYSIPPGGMPTGVSNTGADKPSIVLEVRQDQERRHVERIPLPIDRGVFIEDIVQEAKLQDRIGPLQISIMRPNGPQAPPVRLDLRTDKDGKAVNMGLNYALLPGDHVIVMEDKTSALERMLKTSFKGR